MKNFLMKHAHIIICTFVLTTLLFISISKEKNQSKLYFYIESDSGIVKILPHISSDGRCYVFLPSYAQMENLHIEIPPEMNIFLNEINLSEQTNFDIFELSVDYDCVLNNEVTTTLQFLQSANVATLHIDTVTGTMDAIHESKLNEEFATIALYESNGKLNHLDKACTIKGRGNSTWSYDKKPYSLELSSSSNLLNMGSSSNWILLANAVDESNLHNKIIYDLANELHMSGSPDCRYVDVYLNGSYNGLYLLTTKIENQVV